MLPLFGILFALFGTLALATQNQTHYNPAIPGWHSDPSCVFVPERDNTTFCTSSTFRLTPGLPIHASKDLTNWQLVSHALSRKSQYPEFDQSLAQSDGIWAPTIRYHQGTFYIITIYNNQPLSKSTGLVFKSTDPYSDSAWSDPIRYDAKTIDPDIFWDDDGTAYVATAGTNLQTIDTDTGVLGEARVIWNGTSGTFLEGPHLYKKDGYYYLLTAEGGSGLNHSVTMARSTNIWGPYESHPDNPVLTNRNTSEYFQNIGHADLFHDVRGNWWSSALAWRSGPDGLTYPMGREMVLTPVTWAPGTWPTFSPVRGAQTAWSLPPSGLPGSGPLATSPDAFDFAPNSALPRNLAFWGWPDTAAYTISPPGHPSSLRLTPSTASITDGHANYTAGYDVANRTLAMRLQTHTLFEYSVDVSFAPTTRGEEVGVTVFLNQVQNIALGIVMLPPGNATADASSALAPHFRLVVSGTHSNEKNVPAPVVSPVPAAGRGDAVRLMVRAENETHYAFSAAASARPEDVRVLGCAPATVVSGGDGPFTGSLVGVYATSNGGNGTTPAYISRWRYRGLGQAIGNGEIVWSEAH